MTGEQATEGPERPLLAVASQEERGIEASPCLAPCRRRRPAIQNQPKRPSARSQFPPAPVEPGSSVDRPGLGGRYRGFDGGRFLGEGVRSECLRALSAGDPGEVGAGPFGPADLPGSGRRRVRPRVPQRAAVRGQAAKDQSSAVSPHGVRGGRGGPGRFRHGGMDRVARRQAAAVARLSHRAFATAARATARRSIARRPKTSFAASRTPSGISAACPRCW